MKVKTSLTLSEDLLRCIDRRANGNRSEWIERVVARHLRDLERSEGDLRDAAVFARIGASDSDVLDFTAPISFEVEDETG